MRNFARLMIVCSIFGILLPLNAQPATNLKPALPPLSVAEMEKLWGKPTRISVNFQDTPFPQAIDEIERQSGIRISKGSIKSPVTFKSNDVPFWTTMEALLKPSGLRVLEYGGSRNLDPLSYDIQIIPPEGRSLATPQFTPAAPQQIHPYVALTWGGSSRTNNQNLNYGGFLATPQSHSMPTVSLSAAVLLDPRLRQVPAQVAMRLNTIVDGVGKAVPVQNVQPYEHGGGLMPVISLSFSGEGIAPGPTKLQLVRGKLIFYFETRHEIWEVPKLLQAKEVTKTFKTSEGDFSLTLEDVRGRDGRYQISLRGRGNPDAVRDRKQLWGEFFHSPFHKLTERIQVLDAKGIEYRTGGTSISSGGNNDTDMTITVMAPREEGPRRLIPGEPDKLVVEIPSEIRQLEIPFEVKDLPLP